MTVATPALTIRRATTADEAALAALRFSVGWEIASVKGQLLSAARDERVIFLAEVDGQVVGTTSLVLVDDDLDLGNGWDRAHLNDSAVSPAYRGSGVYWPLVDAGLAEAKERGMTWVYAQTKTAWLVAAHQRRGWEAWPAANGFTRMRVRVNE